MFCEQCLRESLLKLAESNPKLSVADAKSLLASAWNAKEVDLVGIHGRTLLRNALEEPFTVRLVFEVGCEPRAHDEDSVQQAHAHSRVNGAPGGLPGHDQEAQGERPAHVEEPLRDRCIRELGAVERRRDFIWAGFVVNDLLPRLGADKREAQVMFDRMVDEGVILLSKNPNPNNPDFPSTSVQLNHEDPRVRRVLGNEGRSKEFKPIPIRGEPASVTLVRERR